jgi:hypothetical protein
MKYNDSNANLVHTHLHCQDLACLPVYICFNGHDVFEKCTVLVALQRPKLLSVFRSEIRLVYDHTPTLSSVLFGIK